MHSVDGGKVNGVVIGGEFVNKRAHRLHEELGRGPEHLSDGLADHHLFVARELLDARKHREHRLFAP